MLWLEPRGKRSIYYILAFLNVSKSTQYSALFCFVWDYIVPRGSYLKYSIYNFCVTSLLTLFLLCLQYVLKPTFTKQHIAGLDKQGKLYRAYDGTTYLPGIVGLNNIKANDYANVVLQV